MKHNNKYYLFDWKRCGNIEFNSRKKAIHPLFKDLDDSKLNHCYMQLNIYAVMLRRMYNIEVEDRMYIIVFNTKYDNYKVCKSDKIPQVEEFINTRCLSSPRKKQNCDGNQYNDKYEQ